MLPLDLLMLAALIGSILLGFPVSFSIAGTAIAFAFLGWITGTFDLSLLGALGQRAFGLLTNDVLIAIPLFVMMGVVLEKSRIAEELLETMGRLFGSLHGGLGVSVVLVGGFLLRQPASSAQPSWRWVSSLCRPCSARAIIPHLPLALSAPPELWGRSFHRQPF